MLVSAVQQLESALCIHRCFPDSSDGKETTLMQEILGLEKCPVEGNGYPAPVIWPPDVKSRLTIKALMLGKIEGRGRRGWQRTRMASLTQWT